jgi:hypothetical protein
MEEHYIIGDYCIIRDNTVVSGGKRVFEYDSHGEPSFFTALYRHVDLNYPKFFKMDNLCKLGLLASEVLLREKNILDRYPADQVGLILSNAASSIDTDRNYQTSIDDRTAYFPSPSVFVYTLANIVIGEISIRQKLQGESTFFIEEKFSPDRLYTQVKLLLDEGIISCCICGWVEMDGDHYDAVLYLVEKSGPHADGIAIFEPEKLHDIYLQRT